jgi:hypothetical protein
MQDPSDIRSTLRIPLRLNRLWSIGFFLAMWVFFYGGPTYILQDPAPPTFDIVGVSILILLMIPPSLFWLCNLLGFKAAQREFVVTNASLIGPRSLVRAQGKRVLLTDIQSLRIEPLFRLGDHLVIRTSQGTLAVPDYLLPDGLTLKALHDQIAARKRAMDVKYGLASSKSAA